MQDSVLYADPYDDAQVAEQIRRLVIADDRRSLRDKLIANGQRVLKRYEPQRVGEQWQELFAKLKTDGGLAHPAEITQAAHAG
jgi:hypothetical protein